jgi:uncharacterized membrane protein YkvA (DUF1232 family)
MTKNKAPQELSEKKFTKKIRSALTNASSEVIEKAFLLYYTFKDPYTPTWCKGVILGALAYFISFVDGIPDLTPVLGYTDDLGVMIAAISALAGHITDENQAKAKQSTQTLFKTKPQK